ncbi:MAG: hypothetical protein MJ033_02990 [Victivallaceae bacterium]|nr:hypothetical protein [Victivallaceae bacterium]
MKKAFLTALLVTVCGTGAFAANTLIGELVLAPFEIGKALVEFVVDLSCAVFSPCDTTIVETRVVQCDADGNVTGEYLAPGYRRIITTRYGTTVFEHPATCVPR